jgi:hypothetical protein
MSRKERKAWPGTLVDPCLLSGAEDGQVFIEGERMRIEEGFGGCGGGGSMGYYFITG